MCLQRSAHLALKPSGALLVVLNDPTVLVSNAGTGWTLSLEAGLVLTLYLRLWIGSSVPSERILNTSQQHLVVFIFRMISDLDT